MRNKLKDQKWYPYTVAAIIAVAFYVLLSNMGSITNALLTFIGYFKTIFIACVMAYILTPLAMLIE